MASNLRERLKRIHEQKPHGAARNSFDAPKLAAIKDWESCGFQVLKREIISAAVYKIKRKLPKTLGIVIPDLAGRSLPTPEDFLFFDLETTGLSGGAGTVAFLAAFGRFVSGGSIRVTQYLLLDYPGESDFLEAVLGEFKNKTSVVVTYNGKCFDSQILKTRCLMNGIKPPEYCHVDLLHPARRLWKNIVNDCSQASIETRILGLDRSGDVPGALAPEIWFEFLKTGRPDRLAGICDHNSADIKGLSSILAAMVSIAADPFQEKYPFDIEKLAMYMRGHLRRRGDQKNAEHKELRVTGNRLLLEAVKRNCPRAVFAYACDQIESGSYIEGHRIMLEILESEFHVSIKAQALRNLAIYSERKGRDAAGALEFVKKGLFLEDLSVFWRTEFERRLERLERKL